jgi:hypothetical protein
MARPTEVEMDDVDEADNVDETDNVDEAALSAIGKIAVLVLRVLGTVVDPELVGSGVPVRLGGVTCTFSLELEVASELELVGSGTPVLGIAHIRTGFPSVERERKHTYR